MYFANVAAIAKYEDDQKVKEQRDDKNNKYEYQDKVNTLIGFLRERFAAAVFSRNPSQRIKSLKK